MRALALDDPNALGCLIPSSTASSLSRYLSSLDRELPLQLLFGLPHNSATCALADAYLRELEDETEGVEKRHRGPVTQRSLDTLAREGGVRLGWTEYRAGILRYLNGKGVEGVGELMRTTVKGVMDSGV